VVSHAAGIRTDDPAVTRQVEGAHDRMLGQVLSRLNRPPKLVTPQRMIPFKARPRWRVKTAKSRSRAHKARLARSIIGWLDRACAPRRLGTPTLEDSGSARRGSSALHFGIVGAAEFVEMVAEGQPGDRAPRRRCRASRRSRRCARPPRKASMVLIADQCRRPSPCRLDIGRPRRKGRENGPQERSQRGG